MRIALLSRRPVALLAATALLTTGGVTTGLLAGTANAATVTITSVTNPVNRSNQTMVDVEGTSTAGDTVTITATDGTRTVPVSPPTPPNTAVAGQSGTFDNNGTLDVSALADGTITIRVASAVNGSATRTVLKDTVAPVAATNLRVTPSPINAATQSNVTVTADAGADAASVRLSISDGTTTISKFPTASGSTYTATFDVTTLKDGTLTVTASPADAAGNENNNATTTVAKDTKAPNAPAINFSGTASNPTRVNAASPGAGNKITVSNTANPGNETATYVLTVTDSAGTTVAYTPTSSTPSTTYSIPLDPYVFADGPLSFAVVATDPAGNASPSTRTSIGKDTTTPVVTNLTITPNPINAARQTTVTVTGRTVQSFGSSLASESGTKVSVAISGTSIATGPLATPCGGATNPMPVTAAADGTFTATFDTSNCLDGPQAVTASATPTDPAGNVGPTATTKADKDTGAPGKPVVTSLGNAVPANLTAVPFAGTAEPGSTVVVTVRDTGSGSVATTVTAAGNGSYSGTFNATSLADGTITATAVATDAAGNTSPTSDPRSANKDTIAFALISTSPTNGATIGSSSTVQATYNEPLSVSQSSIGVKNSTTNAPIPGNTSYSADGKTISFTPAGGNFPTGSYTATIIGKESGAGNDPAITTVINFSVDATVPAAPVLTSITNPVNAANQANVRVRGTAEPATTVVVTITDSTTDVLMQPAPRSAISNPTLVGLDGTFEATVNTTTLKDGPLSATAVVTDGSGNRSARSNVLSTTKDTVAPVVTGTSATDTNRSTPSTTVTASSGEPGHAVTVTLTDRNGARITASTTSGSGGAISVQVNASSLADGTVTVTVVATDAAGNTSNTGTASFTKDTVGPTVTGLSGTTVNIASGNRTTVSGSLGEPGTVAITVTDGTATRTGSATAAPNGSFSTTIDVSGLADGTLTLTAVGTDARGNTGPSASAPVLKDTVKPVVSGLAATPTSGTNNTTTITGTTEAGASVRVTITDGVKSDQKTVTAGNDGSFSATFDLTGYKSGSLPVTAQATDVAGNTGDVATASASRDATGPTISNLSATRTSTAQPSTTVTGTIDDPRATVALKATDRNGATVTGTATVNGNGSFTGTLNLSTLADGPITVEARGTDMGGNAGSAVTTTTTKDAAAPVVTNLAATASTPTQPNSTVTGNVDDRTATVRVTATDTANATVTGTATVSPSGAFTVSLNLSTLADGPITVRATATDAAGNTGSAVTTTTRRSSDEAGSFKPLQAARVLDTRHGTGAPAGAVPANGSVQLQVTGRGGVPASGVSAVVLNVTATAPTANGVITVYPNGSARPTASNINFNRGRTVPNLVIVKVGDGGKVVLTHSGTGSVQLFADVAGYYVAGTPTAAGAYSPLTPARLLDTRSGNGAPQAAVAPNGVVQLQVTGRGGVPSTGVSSVVLNVTVTGPTTSGFISAYPDGTTRPTASNLNYVRGLTVANLVIVPVSASGKVALFNGSAGTVQLIADVAGYYRSGTPTAPGTFAALSPARVLDTRSGNGAPQGAVASQSAVAVRVTGRGGVPATGVSAVVLNVTVTAPSSSGFVTAYANGTSRPTASNLNFVTGQTVPNLVIVPVGADGKVALYNGGSGTVHLIADVAGYYLS